MLSLLSSFALLLALHLGSGAPNGLKDSDWLKYSELQSLGATFYPGDTCTEPRDIEVLSIQTCECNISCTRYKTCCIDSPYRDTKPSSISSETCHPAYGTGLNVFMITKCKPNWKGDPMVIINCESKRENLDDPLGTAPVTNPQTFTTYKNNFCAICNNDEQDSKLWSIHTEATFNTDQNFTNKYDISELSYDDGIDKWGVWETDQNGQLQFNYVRMEFRIPESVASIVKVCRPDLKTDCAPDWKDDLIRNKCQAYMAAVYVANVTAGGQVAGYHNPHCAICNHVSNYTNIRERRSNSFSFSRLLDLPHTGTIAKEANPNCNSTEKYDPFLKKCRTLVCSLPGFVLRNNRCSRP